MRYLTLEEILALHRLVIAQSGGSVGLRDHRALESAIAQPTMTFDHVDLYPTVAYKAAALGHSLIQNHPFVDGNKRAGHAAMETMLVLNGYELDASTDEQEETVFAAAGGKKSRDELAKWIEQHIKEWKAKEQS